jgi:hypothetical protein
MGLILVQTDDPPIGIFFIEDSPHRMNKRRILMPVKPPKELHSEPRNALREAIDRALCGKTDLQKKADEFLSPSEMGGVKRIEKLGEGFILLMGEDRITKITEEDEFVYRLVPFFTSPKEMAKKMSLNWRHN